MSKSGSGYYSGTSGEGRALISEVQANGDKINPDDVVEIAKDESGIIIWLENGLLNGKPSGLLHILDAHESDFNNKGISEVIIVVKKIRLILDYGCYPVWLYDENGSIVDTLLPEELRSDRELDSKFDDLQARYDALFIDNQHEFSFVGFNNADERDAFFRDWRDDYDELVEKTNGRYTIIDEISKSLK